MKTTLKILKQKEACCNGIDWFKLHGANPELLASKHPEWYLWAAGHDLDEFQDPQLIDASAVHDPILALQEAAEKLSPERFQEIIKERPLSGLVYAPHLLTAEQIDLAAYAFPNTALKYADKYLTDERRKWCLGKKR